MPAQQRYLGEILSSMGAVFSSNPNALPVCPTIVGEALGVNPCSAEQTMCSSAEFFTGAMLAQ